MNSSFQNVKKFVANNSKLIAGLLVACAFIGMVYAIWSDVHRKQEMAAASAYFNAKKQADPLIANKQYDNAIALYEGVSKAHKGTHAAFEAVLAIADANMDQKKISEAIQEYEQATKQAPDQFAKMLAFYSKGTAEETAGKYAEAIKSYESAMSATKSDSLQPELIMAQARCYEAANDRKKAIDLYKKLEERYPGKTFYTNSAMAYRSMLEAKNK
jgi:predicted negative regulator of RcsB-dependent stress response